MDPPCQHQLWHWLQCGLGPTPADNAITTYKGTFARVMSCVTNCRVPRVMVLGVTRESVIAKLGTGFMRGESRPNEPRMAQALGIAAVNRACGPGLPLSSLVTKPPRHTSLCCQMSCVQCQDSRRVGRQEARRAQADRACSPGAHASG